MENIKGFSLYLLLGILAAFVSKIISSTFLETFLVGNLIIIQITLLAINITIISLIFTKIKDISEALKISFVKTTPELKKSILEQIILIILTIVLLVFYQGEILVNSPEIKYYLFNSLLNGVFFYVIYLLFDTGKAIFLLIEAENKQNNKSE